MKVKELITKLLEYPMDGEVIIKSDISWVYADLITSEFLPDTVLLTVEVPLRKLNEIKKK